MLKSDKQNLSTLEKHHQQDLSISVITIDGPSNSGKSTTRNLVAKILGYHSLDSGVFYRALAVHLRDKGILISAKVESLIAFLAKSLKIDFRDEKVFLFGTDRTEEIRSQEVGLLASKLATLPRVREALLPFQLGMRRFPGLVADGRDMGEIFNTPFRFYLTVSPEERAKRKCKELKAKGRPANYELVLAEILERDERDMTRSISPLKPHPKAFKVSGDGKTPEKVAKEITEIVLNYNLT